jgi:hypothetical protein
MNIDGGYYGYGYTQSNITGNSILVDIPTVQAELTNVQYFHDQYISFLSDASRYSLSNTLISSSSMDIFPIQYGYYYSINISGMTPITLTFLYPNNTENVYYFYNPTSTSSKLDLSRITFVNMDYINPHNIYFVSDTDIYLGSTTYQGTFISLTTMVPTPDFDDRPTVNGSLFNLGNNNIAQINVNFTTVCFMEGVKILTDQWYVPVEELKEGDMVMTFGELVDNQCVSDHVPMKIVRMQKHLRKASAKTSPIVFTKNVFGINSPFENLYVSPNHGMIDRKGRLTPAKKFINHISIFQDPTIETITYYHIELEKHCTVMANGVLTETNTQHLKRTDCAPAYCRRRRC